MASTSQQRCNNVVTYDDELPDYLQEDIAEHFEYITASAFAYGCVSEHNERFSNHILVFFYNTLHCIVFLISCFNHCSFLFKCDHNIVLKMFMS